MKDRRGGEWKDGDYNLGLLAFPFLTVLPSCSTYGERTCLYFVSVLFLSLGLLGKKSSGCNGKMKREQQCSWVTLFFLSTVLAKLNPFWCLLTMLRAALQRAPAPQGMGWNRNSWSPRGKCNSEELTTRLLPRVQSCEVSLPWDICVWVLCEGCQWPRKTPCPASEPTASYISDCVRNGVALMMRLLMSPEGFVDQSVTVNKKYFSFSLCLSAVDSELLVFRSVLEKSFKIQIASWEQGRAPDNITFRCLIPCAQF